MTQYKNIIDIIDIFSKTYFKEIETVFIYENSKRILFNQYIDAKDRFKYVKHINNILKTSIDLTYIEILSMRSSKDYAFKIAGCDKLIYVHVKPIGNHPKINCHEFLTASLVLLGIKTPPANNKEINILYSQIEKIISDHKIKNCNLSESNFIEYDLTTLCQSISASKAILDTIKKIPDIAYLTGNGKWDSDIAFLNYKHSSIKNYNSSDIIFKKDDIFYGISLKKKKYISDKDPPLINRSLICIFEKRIQNEFIDIFSKYFIELLTRFYKIQVLKQHPNINNWKKLISEIDVSLINKEIKSDNCILWKNIREIIFKHSDNICNNIINHVLRITLSELKNFIFLNVTGIGRYHKDGGLIIESGEIISLDDILLTCKEHLDRSNISIRRNRDKESEFQSTLFLTIYSKELPIINLEIRYKGRFHTSPEVLAFFTKEFRDIILHIKDNK